MLKHASITRPSKRPASPLWEQQAANQSSSELTRTPSPPHRHHQHQHDQHQHQHHQHHQHQHQHLLSPAGPQSPAGSNASFSSTRLPASFISSIKRNCVGSLPSTPMKSRRHAKQQTESNQSANATSESMIKVFAQTLGQEVEYITLHVNAQTKSQQIIKSLLRKFRLKHRDPNLFYLTLERWIRKDGLKCKNTMLLGDEACPMQYQQCCSNPPYNDIKFTLQTRAGVLVKIHCSDVVPESRYKCLSLSTQTTVEETIELTLHCLNLIPTPASSGSLGGGNACPQAPEPPAPPRQAGSPSSTGSTNSTNSSSSGIDSDLPPNRNNNNNNNNQLKQQSSFLSHHKAAAAGHPLNSSSRASSTTSISSTSNVSTISTSTIDQYCLVIECKDSNYKRILEPDEYLVDVYQSLLTEAREQQELEERRLALAAEFRQQSQSAEQWFFIKLKRRHDISLHPNPISFASARQSMPLPPIPDSISRQQAANSLAQIASTTQIEVRRRPAGMNFLSVMPEGVQMSRPLLLTNPTAPAIDNQRAEAGEACQQVRRRCPPPPALIVLPPLVRPRRRNLSNASSTFLPHTRTASFSSRRHYDPAQLEADLSKLDMSSADEFPARPFCQEGRESVVIDKSAGCELAKPETSPD